MEVSHSCCQNQNQNCLLVTRQNDNHSPGPGRLVAISHQRTEFSDTILGTFCRGDKRVWKCIPIPNGLGEKATLINISVSNGDLICNRRKKRAFEKAIKKQSDWHRYKKIQKEAQQACRRAQDDYISNMVSEPGSNNKSSSII